MASKHQWFKESHEEWCREHNLPVPLWEDDDHPTNPNCVECGGWMESYSEIRNQNGDPVIPRNYIQCNRCKKQIDR